MKEFKFEVKYILKMYYNLHVMKEMKRLLVMDIEGKEGKDSKEYALAKQDLKETEKSLKILKSMACAYYNIKDESEIAKKISDFIIQDPYYELTRGMAENFYTKIFKKIVPEDEIN